MSSKTAPERGARAWSLAARLTAWYAGSAFLLVLAATGFLYWVLISNLEREDDQFLADQIHYLRTLLRDRPDEFRALKKEAELEWASSEHIQVYKRILDEDGQILMETPGMHGLLPPDLFPHPAAINTQPGVGNEVEVPGKRSFRVLSALASHGRSNAPRYVIHVALDRTGEEELLAGYRLNLWLVLGLALVLCALAGYQIARRGLRPLREMAESARRIRSTTLNERLVLGGLPAELSLLAGTFNEMLDRLEESFSRLSRFSADIAHELRTPVNNLRGEVEVALGKPRSPEEYRDVLASSLDECGRLARLIDSLLFLARAESPQTEINREPVDVGRELEVVREFFEAAATDAGIQLTNAAPSGLIAELDRMLFQRAVSNLLANALAHTPAGGRVRMDARAGNGGLCIEVADTGSGIAKEHLTHVFDRFFRADGARSATSGRVGLGLAIVKSIATLHRGKVEITSELGRGTSVRVFFPSPSKILTESEVIRS
jgi:two-component system heavy metal sensor histidine kinase CusS